MQTARTVDAVAKTGAIAGPFGAPITNFVNGVASIGKKIVYPLIIGSGIYNTVKSDDKVKVGASNACGITTMYCFEQIAEKGLNSINKALSKSEKFTNNKVAKVAWYIVKGLTFVAASLGGYNIGSKAAETIVDEKRKTKEISKTEDKNIPKAINAESIKEESKTFFPIEDGLKESQIFAEMQL